MEGYGLYWYCLEIIAGNVDQYNVTFELEHDAEIISFDTGLHRDQVQEMMTFMIELGLFENSNGIVTCLKMAKRLDQSMTSNQELRKVIDKVKKNHDCIMIKSEQRRREEKRIEEIKEVRDFSDEKITPPPRDLIPLQQIIDLYHEILPELPKVAKLTAKRKGQIQQRWREDIPSLNQWKNFFNFVRQNDFLMGRCQGRDGRPPFRADIEWLTNSTNFTKIAEKKYVQR